jgi:hypothetical protein
MGYWKDRYKKCPHFIEGVIVGVKAYAKWKNGEQVVGTLERPLKEVIEEIEKELGGK